MIRSNLKSGAQGVVDTYTLSAQGEITIQGSAGAQCVALELKNPNSGSLVLRANIKSGTYDTIYDQEGFTSGDSGNVRSAYAFIKPLPDTDVVINVYTFTGGATSTNYYSITP